LNVLPRVGLGTAQLGADYGISNCEGRPSEAEAAAILARAMERGIEYIDTAASYPNAEKLLGRHLPSRHQVRIVTKLPLVEDDVITARCTETALATIAASLERLRLPRVYGVLVHHARDLAKPGWQYLIDALCEIRARGWTSTVGVSVYDGGDLAIIESRFTPDIVQLPFNALDRRLAESGWLARLHGSGVEIHARSVFLQGLLLMEPASLPRFFAPISETLAQLHARWAAEKRTPLAGCLDCALHNPNIDVVVVGVNRLRELDEIAAATAGLGDADAKKWPPMAVDPLFLDPRRWPTSLQ
jgi:aryl-alcohol dehydrogenase-like predicted oxidoreductase